MPYITTEKVKEKRARIKKAFPNFKFSITREHYSTINVDILEAPFNMLTNKEGQTYEQVNHFYIEEHYKNTPKIKDVLLGIYEIMRDGRRVISEDSDYGSIPNFYTNISIGRWDRSFQVKCGR